MGEDQDRRPSAELALQNRTTFLIGTIANRLVSAASALYRRRFGIGFSEWRIMVMLGLEAGITAKHISESVGLDKAAISRGVKWLEERGLIEPTPETAGRRSRSYRLTRAGRELHDRVVPIARDYERLLLADLDAGEQAQLLGLLQRLMNRLPAIEAFRL